MIKSPFLKRKILRLPALRDLKIEKGTRVLLRVDYNVPMKGSKVTEPWKIEMTLPTINFLLTRGARVMIFSHLGRPGGVFKPELSLSAIAAHLSILLKKRVEFFNALPPNVSLKKNIQGLRSGTVSMLENLRFSPGEDAGDMKFAKELAKLGEVYVNDAFAVCHRPSASIVVLPKLMPHAAGLLLEKEVLMLGKLFDKTLKPLMVIMGGAKISDKIGVIKNLLPVAEKVMLGGALANNFFAAAGYGMGASLCGAKEIDLARTLLKEKKIILPQDVVVGVKGVEKSARVVKLGKHPKKLAGSKEAILDIGPETIGVYAREIKKAVAVVWNGPLGYFEEPQFSHGTLALARIIAARSKGKAFGVIGGGETVEALRRTKMETQVDWVSTGGGAMLEFLEGKELPGIKALM